MADDVDANLDGFGDASETTAARVLEVMDCLAAEGISAWIGGGWGVDALVGRQTRTHCDVDLVIDAARFAAALAILDELGFRERIIDWLPIRLELADSAGAMVDAHPVTLAADGSGVQAGPDGSTFDYPLGAFTTGHIAGRAVLCLSREQQLTFHSGYDPRSVDQHDIALLVALTGDLDESVGSAGGMTTGTDNNVKITKPAVELGGTWLKFE